MKTLPALGLAFVLSTSLIGTAQADRGGRHYGYNNHYNPPPAQRHYGHNRNWAVPAAVLAITGLAIGAAAYNSYQPRPTYVY